MIPFIGAATMFGRSGRPTQAIRHVAFNNLLSGAERAPFMWTADGDDGLFIRRHVRGDLSLYVRSGAGRPGAFLPSKHLVTSTGDILLGGSIYLTATDTRPALFRARASDPTLWEKLGTGLETIESDDYRPAVVGIAELSGKICVLEAGGERAVSTDGGDSWATYANIGGSGMFFLYSWPSGFVAGGGNGRLFTAADPAGTWTSRTSQFETGIAIIDGAYGGGVHVIVGSRHVVTSSNATTWTRRSFPAGSPENPFPRLLAHADGRWFMAGDGGLWLTSTTGTAWTKPALSPQFNGSDVVRSMYKLGDEWFVHWANGYMSKSDDNGTSWDPIFSTGLPSASYPVSFGLA